MGRNDTETNLTGDGFDEFLEKVRDYRILWNTQPKDTKIQ